MAIKHCPTNNTTRALQGDMTVKEFKEWLKSFDMDGDGRISKVELRCAIRAIGGRFSWWKSGRGIKMADTNGDGFIGDNEIQNLMEFAQKRLGLKIVASGD